jgi:intracellular multiplication protein IcmP
MSDSKGGTDPAIATALFVGFVLAVGWVIWYFNKEYILESLRYMRLSELWVLKLWDVQAASCFNWLKVAPIQLNDQVAAGTGLRMLANECFDAASRGRMLGSMSLTEANQYFFLSAKSMGAISNLTGNYIKWLLIALTGVTAYYAYFRSPRNKFKTRYNLESFIKVQSKTWPVISPIVNFNPAKHSARFPGSSVPDKLPLFAEALSPEEWLAFHRISVSNGIPDREATRRAFMRQLGPRWTNIEDLPLHMQGLFAAFALKGVQRREESDDLLGKLALSWTHDKGFHMPGPLEGEVKRLMRDPEVGGKAAEIANQHAYRTTALLGVLRWARFMGGVLAPAQFVWLRGVDRDVWYPLNNLGRRSFHTEGAGAMAHFMAEQAAQKPLIMPRLDTAIVTLNQFLADRRAGPIPPREEPKSQKLLPAPRKQLSAQT